MAWFRPGHPGRGRCQQCLAGQGPPAIGGDQEEVDPRRAGQQGERGRRKDPLAGPGPLQECTDIVTVDPNRKAALLAGHIAVQPHHQRTLGHLG